MDRQMYRSSCRSTACLLMFLAGAVVKLSMAFTVPPLPDEIGSNSAGNVVGSVVAPVGGAGPLPSTDQEQSSSGEGANSPYDDLFTNQQKRVEEIVKDLNRSILNRLQDSLNSYHSDNREEAIAYCEDKVLDAFNGSLTIFNNGCDLTVKCTYKPNRFPALLLTGECGQLHHYCGSPNLKTCVKHDIRVAVLNYMQVDSGLYTLYSGGVKKDGESLPTPNEEHWEWLEGRELVVTDCACER